MIECQRNGIYASPSAGPDAAPEGIYARVAAASSTLSDGKTRRRCTHENEVGVGPSFWQARHADGRGKVLSSPDAAGETLTRLPLQSFRAPFFLLKPEIFQPRGTQ
jgi:hypothetical protein